MFYSYPPPLPFSVLFLPFGSTKLFRLILVLFHSLNAFTAFFFSCSHSVNHHSFFFLIPFVPLTITSPSFLLLALRIWLFLVSSYTLLRLGHTISLLSHSSVPLLLLLFPFLHGSFLLYLFLAGDGSILLIPLF
jgi:hypothetical protein